MTKGKSVKTTSSTSRGPIYKLCTEPGQLFKCIKRVGTKVLDSKNITMYRSNYGNPPPATSPPLHHPVPQHVSTVPQLRSPPPPISQSQQQSGYGTPYQTTPQGGQGAGNAFGAYGQFINDPTAQMASQFGQTAFKHGTEYLEQNVGGETSVLRSGANCSK